ncbi:MAG: hypothetical protein ACYC8T_04330 [Myxococcaceae bacterium]
MMRFRPVLVGLAASLVLVGLWSRLVTPLGDISNHYTDHLRHMGESLALLTNGWSTYRQPYAIAVETLPLPCPDHAGLWSEHVSLYPPLGLLAHAPMALLERDRVLRPQLAHELMGLFFLLVALAAIGAAFVLLRGAPLTAKAGLALIGAPLLVGTGANGIFDVLFLLLLVLALLAYQSERWSRALVLFAAAGALHFRAAVLLPFAVIALHRAAKLERRSLPIAGALAALLVAPAVYAAMLVARFAVALPPNNPAHYSHHRWPFWLVVTLAAGVAAWTYRTSKEAAASFLTAALLTVLDPVHVWWHALLFIPPVLSLATCRTAPGTSRFLWPAAWAWAVAMGFVVYRYELGPYWQWMAFAVKGVS